MKRNIDAQQSPDLYHLSDQSPVLEIYANQDFDTSDGERVLAGDPALQNFYRSITCSVVDGQLVVPAIVDIDTTEDSPDNQRATYSAYLRADGQQLIDYLLTFRVPPSTTTPVSSISWMTLRIHKSGIIQREPLTTYTKAEILALIETEVQIAVGTLNDAGAYPGGPKGRVYLTTTPTLPTEPKAVSDGDPRVPSQGENDALVGTSGTPGTSNKYVTNADGRVPTQSENDALVGTSGNPSSSNKYITNADPRVPTQGESDALVGTNGTPSSSNAYVTNFDPRVSSVVNVRSAPYNAYGDGSTDDTAAVLAALAVALADRLPLYFPFGTYVLSGSGSEILLLNKAIEMFGDGAGASVLLVASTVPGTRDVIRIAPPASGIATYGLLTGRDNRGYYLHDFSIAAASGTPARDAIRVDTTTTDQYIHDSSIERVHCFHLNNTGRSLHMTNSDGAGSFRNQDGIFKVNVSHNAFHDGFLGEFIGDTNNFIDNTIRNVHNTNLSVDFTVVPGATTVNFSGNNSFTMGGWRIRGGYQINLIGNVIEAATGAAGSNGALLDLAGDQVALLSPLVIGNQVNVINGVALNAIRVNTSTLAQLAGNNLTAPAGKTGIEYTVNATNPVISGLNLTSGGGSSYTNASASAAFVPNVTQAEVAKFPGFMGVDHIQTKMFRVNEGVTSPTFPTTGEGLEVIYDSDGRILSGAYSSSGGAGALLFQVYSRNASAFRDAYFAGATGLLDFSNGITFGTGTASATSGAATLNKQSGTITSEALTTAAGADYVLTLTNSLIAAISKVMVTVDNGTNTTEGIAVNRVSPGSGSVIIRIRNTHAASALNGTLKINFAVF